MLDYFKPVDFSFHHPDGKTPGTFSMGKAIEKSTTRLLNSGSFKPDVVIMGVPVESNRPEAEETSSPDAIRGKLYSLAMLDRKIKIADLGNLKTGTSLKGTFLALRDVIEYFRELNVISVVLGGRQDLTVGICEAFGNNRFFSLTVIDAMLDIKKGIESFHASNFLTRIFKKYPHLFQFSLVGYQKQLVGARNLEKTTGVADHLRLGQLRDDFFLAEPVLRNTDVLSFDMGAVKYSDAPATLQKNPNGLRGEEACQLGRYAGMSERLKVFGVFELIAGEDYCGVSARLAAEIVWYFLEGCSLRNHRSDFAGEDRVMYKVALSDLEQPMVFYEDPVTDRWWYEVSSVSGETKKIACSEKEYRQAADNEIPERWLKFVQKMDQLPK